MKIDILSLGDRIGFLDAYLSIRIVWKGRFGQNWLKVFAINLDRLLYFFYTYCKLEMLETFFNFKKSY